jgi:hypothetical protein
MVNIETLSWLGLTVLICVILMLLLKSKTWIDKIDLTVIGLVAGLIPVLIVFNSPNKDVGDKVIGSILYLLPINLVLQLVLVSLLKLWHSVLNK